MRVIRSAIRHSTHQSHPKGPQVHGVSDMLKVGAQAAMSEIRRRDEVQLASLRAWASQKAAPVSQEARKDDPGTHGPEVVPSVKDRPTALEEIVGQEALVGQLRMVMAGARLRGTQVPHALIVGPSGHGKTTLASVIAGEIHANLITTSAVMLKKPGDLIGLIVKSSGEPTVLFIDEIHALPKKVMETLYTALEDARVDVLAGSGMDTVAYSHDLPHLVVVGATTRAGLLTEPFRQRFGFTGEVTEYDDSELAEIVKRSWDRVGVTYAETEPLEVALRSKGVPRRALALGERVLDFAAVMERDVTEGTAAEALATFDIDANGLDQADYSILGVLVESGTAMGLENLAAATNLDPKTISDDHEPYLIRAGLVKRTRTGRAALQPAYDLLREAS